MKLAQEGLQERLVGLELIPSQCRVTEVSKVEGDCYTYNRKGKLYLFWDLNVTLKWKSEGAVEEDGTIELPNVSDDLESEDLEVNVTAKSKQLKDDLRGLSRPLLQGLILQYFRELKQSVDRAPNQNDAPPQNNNENNNSDATKLTTQISSSTSASTSKSTQVGKSTTKSKSGTELVEITLSVQCPREGLFEALTNQQRVMGFTGAPARIDFREGGDYELFNGSIRGKYVEIVPNEKIVMTWWMGGWEEGCESRVNITLSGSNPTTLKLVHDNIPSRDSYGSEVRAQVERGWHSNFFTRMRAAFGWAYSSN
eukprot:c10257_g1_i2.p1 GENE.c10257_g1_i2~~c10257_g1_i2.p1  ORF type:complete len:356 (+),score=89.98 c10257_g1_i2:138-1070(+)